MKSNKTKKTIALSITMALVMMAGDLVAQYDEERYGLQPWFGTSLMGKQGSGDGYNAEDDFGLPDEHGGTGDAGAPLGGGTLLLVGLGAAYTITKKRREE